MREYSTIAMLKRHQMISLMLLLVAMFSGCASEKAETEVPVPPVVIEEPKEPESMSLLLACATANSNNALTRLSDDVVQLNGADSYRNLSDFRFFARRVGSDGKSIINAEVDDPQESANKPDAPQKPTSRFYHSDFCKLTPNVSGLLVYAKAKDDVQSSVIDTRKYNGYLNVDIPAYVYSTSVINAEPASIISDAAVGTDGIPAEAWTLADALTDIANIDNWNTINDTKLKPLLAHFTNNGYDLAGSAASVRAWIGVVKKTAEDMGSLGDGQTDELIRKEIMSKADEYLWLDRTKSESAKSIRTLSYPQSINLPDGAAVLRWTEVEGEGGVKVKKFVPQLQTTTLDDINSVSRFAYPASLHYFVNSDIWTSNSPLTFDDYKGRSTWKGNENTWNGGDDDTVQWLFKDGGTVTKNTKTVAVADPLQYAVARLNLTVEVDPEITALKYNGTNTIAYTDGTNYNFRLTGVIIGGQRKVGYNFKPIDNSDMDVKFVYDSQVGTNFYLKKKSEYPNSTLVPVNTLLLQSWDGEDVNVILEFEYTAATTGAEEFKCLNGYVYPGTRFYLVGEVKAKDFKQGTGDEASRGRVFTQDYTTTIEMTVKSLEKAYNVLPNIIAKNLEIGVMTTPKWKAATPSDPVIME